jgi:TrmH family RNA methyltransferase
MITSRANPAVKEIRALRHPKERERTGRFFVEGIRIVLEAAELGRVETLVVAPALLSSPTAWQTVEAQREAGVPCLEVSRDVFVSISAKEGPQGLGAVVRQRWERLWEVEPAGELCWVALAGVQDPGNLGTILRTGNAVGAAGVILLGPTADPHDPSAVRASMGAIFSQRLVRSTFFELVAWKSERGFRLVGTSDAAALDYLDCSYQPPLILCMGSEREGLSAEEQALCDAVVSIPMVGRGDSLNLAVATSVILYEIFNQRRRLRPR